MLHFYLIKLVYFDIYTLVIIYIYFFFVFIFHFVFYILYLFLFSLYLLFYFKNWMLHLMELKLKKNWYEYSNIYENFMKFNKVIYTETYFYFL
jgi:hypothetical protein